MDETHGEDKELNKKLPKSAIKQPLYPKPPTTGHLWSDPKELNTSRLKITMAKALISVRDGQNELNLVRKEQKGTHLMGETAIK